MQWTQAGLVQGVRVGGCMCRREGGHGFFPTDTELTKAQPCGADAVMLGRPQALGFTGKQNGCGAACFTSPAPPRHHQERPLSRGWGWSVGKAPESSHPPWPSLWGQRHTHRRPVFRGTTSLRPGREGSVTMAITYMMQNRPLTHTTCVN